ncbi:MAG: hypothetical protein K6E17_09170, partial [Clostridiales bacterium]|nr:hypothetical protein [Clostridiales bacterium]
MEPLRFQVVFLHIPGKSRIDLIQFQGSDDRDSRRLLNRGLFRPQRLFLLFPLFRPDRFFRNNRPFRLNRPGRRMVEPNQFSQQFGVFFLAPGNLFRQFEKSVILQAEGLPGQFFRITGLPNGAELVQIKPRLVDIKGGFQKAVILVGHLFKFFFREPGFQPDLHRFEGNGGRRRRRNRRHRSRNRRRLAEGPVQQVVDFVRHIRVFQNRLVVRMQFRRDPGRIHSLQVTDQLPVRPSGLAVFPFLQPLKPGPFVPDPPGVHTFGRRADHNHQPGRKQRGDDIRLKALSGGKPASPGIEYAVPMIPDDVIQNRTGVALCSPV